MIDPVVFLDTSYAIALSAPRDLFHEQAVLIDCVSYVVMRERGITEALTTDEHFRQMGFRALLRER
jgi:uncharacterized protein